MPPLPPSSSGGWLLLRSFVVVGFVVFVGSSSSVGRRFRGRRSWSSRRSSSRLVVVEIDSELEAVELPPSSLSAITTTAITQADDHRDQAGDEQAHVAVRPVAVRATVRRAAPSGGSGPRASGLYSSGPRIASRIAAVSSISNPFRSRASISSRLLPETAIWVASRRAPAALPARARHRSRRRPALAGATALRCERRRLGGLDGGCRLRRPRCALGSSSVATSCSDSRLDRVGLGDQRVGQRRDARRAGRRRAGRPPPGPRRGDGGPAFRRRR